MDAQQNKVTVSYIFNHSISNVWNVIKDVRESDKILTNIRTDLKFLNGSNSYEKGSIFRFKWRKMSLITFLVDDVIDTEEYKKLTIKCIKTDPIDMRYVFTYHLYINTTDNNTLLVWEIFLDSSYTVSNQEELCKLEMEDLFDKIDSHLTLIIKEVYQNESIILNVKRNKLWAIISNWNILQKIVPFIADEVVYDGVPDEVDSNLTLKWVKKNVEVYLKVNEVDCDRKSDIWVYSLICVKGIPVVKDQKIRFKIFTN